MPLIQITLAGATADADVVAALQAETTALMRDILGKEAALTVVSIATLPAGRVSANGLPVAAAAWLQAQITAGTNSAGEKAAFIAAADAMLRRQLGALEAPVYVVVHEVPAGDWGYDGRTQAARRLERQAALPDGVAA